jgi:hypothetical protein
MSINSHILAIIWAAFSGLRRIDALALAMADVGARARNQKLIISKMWVN